MIRREKRELRLKKGLQTRWTCKIVCAEDFSQDAHALNLLQKHANSFPLSVCTPSLNDILVTNVRRQLELMIFGLTTQA